MIRTTFSSRARFVWSFSLTLAIASPAVRAQYQVPDPAFNAPTHYYDAAIGTGFDLRTNLHNIISSGVVSRSYGDQRYAMGGGASTGSPTSGGNEWVDPANPNNVILVYNGASVSAKWDAGVTWNREHIFPKKWLSLTSDQVSNSYKGVASDSFELRASNPNVNSARGDLGYGFYPQTGSGSPQNYGANNGYWYPGDSDRGEIARGMFYMATRWFDPTNPSRGTSNTNLDLKNGTPTLYNMGDLNSLLHWNYQEGVDNYERRANQYIYGSSGDLTNHALNPTYYQGNRNPFIDHPEYVWAIFGGGNNDSQMYVGATPNGDGSSTANVDLGRVIRNSALGTASINLQKSGVDPTTFDITTTGNATSTLAGRGQAMDYNAQSKTMTVGLSSSTSTVGIKSGTVVINNTDLTSSATGHGSSDGDDSINISATVVEHSTPSFASLSAISVATIDFGIEGRNLGGGTAAVSVSNLADVSGFTAGLDLDSIIGVGATAQLTTNATTFKNLTAGTSKGMIASLGASSNGTLSASYTFNLSDEDIPGAASRGPLTLVLKGIVATPGDTDLNNQIDGADYAHIDTAFSNEIAVGDISGWGNGDFNGDGKIDGADYALIDFYFADQVGSLERALAILGSPGNGTGFSADPALKLIEQHLADFGEAYRADFLAAVPEPGTVLVSFVSLIFVGAKRRRRA